MAGKEHVGKAEFCSACVRASVCDYWLLCVSQLGALLCILCIAVLRLGFCQPHWGLSPGSVRQRDGGVGGWLQRLRGRRNSVLPVCFLFPRGPLEQDFAAPAAAVPSYSSGSIHFPVAPVLAGAASLHR